MFKSLGYTFNFEVWANIYPHKHPVQMKLHFIFSTNLRVRLVPGNMWQIDTQLISLLPVPCGYFYPWPAFLTTYKQSGPLVRKRSDTFKTITHNKNQEIYGRICGKESFCEWGTSVINLHPDLGVFHHLNLIYNWGDI